MARKERLEVGEATVRLLEVPAFGRLAMPPEIRRKLQDAWDAAGPGAAVSGRNKLISTKVRVRAKGTFNEIDPNQANAQIVLSGVDSLEIFMQ